jgi:hypothetical protein
MPDASSGDRIELTWSTGAATRTYEFQGILIAEASSRRARSTRWAELRLYHVTDGTDRFVLVVIGRSLVYHVLANQCGKAEDEAGILVEAAMLPAGATACPRCHILATGAPQFSDAAPEMPASTPPPTLGTVRMESDRYSVYACESAEVVVEHLRSRSTGDLSRTALELMDQAVTVDDRFNAPLHKVERL